MSDHVLDATPSRLPHIDTKALEHMVDSSLRYSDNVIADDQSIKGEKWIYRHAHWRYVPYEFEIGYHINDSKVEVVFFHQRWVWPNIEEWKPIATTAEYRELLFQADRVRKQLP